MSKSLCFLIMVALVFSLGAAKFLGVDISTEKGILYVIGSALLAVVLAFLISVLLAGVYWLFTQKRLPGLNGLIWFVWAAIVLLEVWANSA